MNKKTITLFSLFVAIVCIAARTVMLIYATESATGFFLSRLSLLGIVLSITVFILTILATVFAFTASDDVKSGFEIKKTGSILSILLGISLIAYCFGFGLHDSAFLWQRILEIISGILSGVYFIALGISAFYHIKLPIYASVIPAVHWIFRLVVVFSTFSSNALVAEHIFSLAALCISCVFMLIFGKNRAEIQSEKSKKLFYPLAICGAVLNLSSAVPRLIVTIIGAADKVHGEANIDAVTLILGIFMLVITADISNEKKIGEKENGI